MAKVKELILNTDGERFYNITEQVQSTAAAYQSGIMYLFIMHTSCALTISEAFDDSARIDMEVFLRHLAPEHLSFIKHTAEGPDDSPSHMKSILLQQSLCLPIEQGEVLLGTWQGIYLAEFRKAAQNRRILVKFLDS
ncbi:MAG: secondary thiamine-phosphate synthase enzyme YjbQ [Oligoflexales bacterium]